MSNFIQLNLFNKELPNWANITIEWLLEYLVSLYPEMKFKLFEKEDYDGNNYFCIKQTVFKKVKLEFYLDEFDSSVTWCKNRNYISCTTEKEFGNWCGMSAPIDNIEDFLELLPILIKRCKESFLEYKENIRKRSSNDR